MFLLGHLRCLFVTSFHSIFIFGNQNEKTLCLVPQSPQGTPISCLQEHKLFFTHSWVAVLSPPGTSDDTTFGGAACLHLSWTRFSLNMMPPGCAGHDCGNVLNHAQEHSQALEHHHLPAKCLNDPQHVSGPCKLALLSFLSRFREPERSSSHLSHCQHEGLLQELWAAAHQPAPGQRLMPGTASTDRAFGACPGQG